MTYNYTPYVVPDTALSPSASYGQESEAEYRDMCRARSVWYSETGEPEPDSIKVLRAHEQELKTARAALLQGEIDAWNEGHPLTETGEKPHHLMAPFNACDLHVPDYGWTGYVDENDRGRPVYETKIYGTDELRVPYIIKQVEGWHEQGEHSDTALHPFCTFCRRREEYAEASLRWWLAGHPRAEIPRGEPRPLPVGEDPVRKTYVSLSDLDAFPEPSWLVRGLLPANSVGYLSGFDGTFKTFAALNFALRLASSGKHVLYVMGEGVFATRQRVAAWCEHNAVDPRELNAYLDIRTSTVDLFDTGADYNEMIQRANARRYELVVIDTLARSVGAGNQDSASDMSLVTQRLDELKRACGGTVLVIAHTGKDPDRGIRGSSALRANADFAITMKRGDENTVRMSTRVEHGGKQKDGATDAELLLAAKQVGESMVLVKATNRPGQNVLASSFSNENRVLVALTQTRHLGFVSQAAIRRVTGDDGSGRGEINDGTLSKVVNRLVGDGVVEKHESKKEYQLNTSSARARTFMDAAS